MRIFLIEDSAVARSVEVMLIHSRVGVTRTNLGEKEFDSTKPHGDVVLDLALPDMSNSDVVRILRQAVHSPIGGLVVNLYTKSVEVCGTRIHVTDVEYRILELLVLHKGTIVTKEMFLDHLQNGTTNLGKFINKFICTLRKKLADEAQGQDFIETVWGQGYILKDSP